MKQWNRIILFLLLNIFISACTTMTVLVLWDRTQSSIFGDTLSGLSLGFSDSSSTAIPTQKNTPVPAATPTPSVLVHEVQAGDTFESIASLYGVTVDELLKENGYNQAQALSPGDLMRVPVRIVEIDSVVGVGDIELERVIIRNLVPSELSLAGWSLVDEAGNQFSFPQVKIYVAGGIISVYSKAGVDTVLELFWGLNEPTWQSGEIVTLRDSAGSIRAIYQIP